MWLFGNCFKGQGLFENCGKFHQLSLHRNIWGERHPVPGGRLITLPTRKPVPDHASTPSFNLRPGAVLPRWIVASVLVVAAS